MDDFEVCPVGTLHKLAECRRKLLEYWESDGDGDHLLRDALRVLGCEVDADGVVTDAS